MQQIREAKQIEKIVQTQKMDRLRKGTGKADKTNKMRRI